MHANLCQLKEKYAQKHPPHHSIMYKILFGKPRELMIKNDDKKYKIIRID